MTYEQLIKLIATLTVAQTIAIILGLVIYRFVDSYIKQKGQNLAQIEDSPRLKNIESKIDRLSSIQSEIGNFKVKAYLKIGSLLAGIVKEYELINEWKSRIEGDEDLARLSIEFSGGGSLTRLKQYLDELETIRISHEWLLHWKVAATLYAINLKGLEALTALKFFREETERWEVKRGHFYAVSSLGSVLQEFQEVISKAASEDIESGIYLLHSKYSDEEFADFAKKLGDIGREESRQFSEKYPEIWKMLREVNAEKMEKKREKFKAQLAESLSSKEH